MNEPASVKEPTPVKLHWRQVYSPWMFGVLVVFAVCEGFLFAWGSDAAIYATLGLFPVWVFGTLRYSRVRGMRQFLEAIVLFAITIIFLMLLLPAIQVARESARRMQCMNHLKQLGLALYNYESTWGRFPPAFVADETGRPVHSWRTLLLPYIERQDLYDAYDFLQPWDSAENQKLAMKSGLDQFRCPSCDFSDQPEYRANYVAVLGDETFWPSDGTSRTEADVTAGLSNVVLLVEIHPSDIAWHEPRDVTLDDFLTGKISWDETAVHESQDPFYEPQRSRNVVFGDGSVHCIEGTPTPDQFRRLFSIKEFFDVEKELPQIHKRPIVFRHVVFWVWLATLVMQFAYIFFPVGKPGK